MQIYNFLFCSFIFQPCFLPGLVALHLLLLCCCVTCPPLLRLLRYHLISISSRRTTWWCSPFHEKSTCFWFCFYDFFLLGFCSFFFFSDLFFFRPSPNRAQTMLIHWPFPPSWTETQRRLGQYKKGWKKCGSKTIPCLSVNTEDGFMLHSLCQASHEQNIPGKLGALHELGICPLPVCNLGGTRGCTDVP